MMSSWASTLFSISTMPLMLIIKSNEARNTQLSITIISRLFWTLANYAPKFAFLARLSLRQSIRPEKVNLSIRIEIYENSIQISYEIIHRLLVFMINHSSGWVIRYKSWPIFLLYLTSEFAPGQFKNWRSASIPSYITTCPKAPLPPQPTTSPGLRLFTVTFAPLVHNGVCRWVSPRTSLTNPVHPKE